MVTYRGDWDEGDVERFLQETTVPVRIATRRPDGSPWIVALWFRYTGDVLECATSASADLARFLRRESAVGFDVSTNQIPYRGVRGHGEATVAADDEKAVLADLVERYLGGTDSPLAEWLLGDERDEVQIEIEPVEVYSWDYSDRMQPAAEP